MAALRQQLADFLRFTVAEGPVSFTVHERIAAADHTRLRLTYPDEAGVDVPAFLLLPAGVGPFPAVLLHHQHHGQRHWGKSEVCGLVGDRWQAFAPALARRGVAVLAPDSICFEDRRRGATGLEPHEDDVAQHYNELAYRLLRGDTLMRKVLADSARAVTLLRHHPQIDGTRIGMMGHSYGGNTVLFHAPLDERVRFACASGAACSFAYRLQHDIGIEMASVIPGFAARYDIVDLIRCMAPRPLLLLSATADKFAMDATEIVAQARMVVAEWPDLEHQRYDGGHGLTQTRFEAVVRWLEQQAGVSSDM